MDLQILGANIEPTIPYGNLQPLHKNRKSVGDEVEDIYKYAKAKGWQYCGTFAFLQPRLFVLDLELLKNILAKDFSYFLERGHYFNEKDDPISANLFSLGGERWVNLRGKLTASFTSGKLKNIFKTISSVADVLEEYLKETVQTKSSVEIKSVLESYTIDIIGSCGLGLECNSFKDSDTPFRTFGRKTFEKSKFQILSLHFRNAYPNLCRILGMKGHSKSVNNFFHHIVEDTIKYRQANNITRQDFLQLLIDIMDDSVDQRLHKRDGKTLTLDDIIAQCYIFFMAGFETSATTMSFAMYEMALNSKIQEKARKELYIILGKYNNKLTYEAVTELRYLGQIVEETLRKYPPLPQIHRECIKDYKISGTDLVIEKGVAITVPIIGIHHDPDYYENPHIFDPDRFSEENKKFRQPYTYLPFGEGPRTCIGLRLGIIQTTVGLASILKNFELDVDRSKTPVPLIMSTTRALVLNSQENIWLNMKRVQNSEKYISSTKKC